MQHSKSIPLKKKSLNKFMNNLDVRGLFKSKLIYLMKYYKAIKMTKAVCHRKIFMEYAK